jgi:sugar phosphate isomerase/epimerase
MTARSSFTRRDVLRAVAATAIGGPALSACGVAAEPAGYQLGCYTRPWGQFEYQVALDGIAEAGFQYAGLMTAKGKTGLVVSVDSTPEDVAAVAEEVKRRGLRTISIYAGDFPVAKSVEAGIAGLKKLVDYSAMCACPNLMLAGTADEKLFKPYYKVVAECCDYAAAKGVGLSVKPHGGLNATGAQCRKVIETVGHRNFRVWYDGGNILYYSDGKVDPVDDVPAVADLVVGLSVKDFKLPKEVFVTPGTGRLNFPAMMAGLRKGGFTSVPLVVECLDRGDTAAKITAEAKKARRFLLDLTESLNKQ